MRIIIGVVFTVLLLLSITTLIGSSPTYAMTHGLHGLIGLFVYWMVSSVSFRTIQRYTWLLLFFVAVLLVLTMMQSIVVKGAARWLRIGTFQVQPSQLALPAMMLGAAALSLDRSRRKVISKTLLWASIPMLVFLQPNFSTTVILLSSILFAWWFSGTSYRWFASLALIGGVLGIFGWSFVLKPYQQQRIQAFLDPTRDELGVGYNARQAQIAVGAGGFWGVGLGNGTQSLYGFLPEKQTDFLFSAYAEQFGFLGVVILLSVYVTLFSISFHSISYVNDPLHRVYGMGWLSLMGLVSMIHLGMNLGLVPVTGLPLPFFSVGGSSLISVALGFGILHARTDSSSQDDEIDIRRLF